LRWLIFADSAEIYAGSLLHGRFEFIARGETVTPQLDKIHFGKTWRGVIAEGGNEVVIEIEKLRAPK